MLQFKNLFKVKPFSIASCLGISNTTLFNARLQYTLSLYMNIPFYSFSRAPRGVKLAPSNLPSFQHYNLASDLLDVLDEKQIYTPTPIQDMVIREWFKSPKHLVFAAQTGTGKTLAFVLPLLQKLKLQEMSAKAILTQPNRPRAIIFVPSKELVMQTLSVIKDFCHIVKLRAIGLAGEDTYQREKQCLDDGTDILVTTIDKFQKHSAKENVYISQCQYLIFDEMDTFMDSGFDEVIGGLIQRGVKMASKPQMVFLSSTFTERIRALLISTLGKEDVGFRLLIDKKLHYNLSNLDHEFLHLDTLDKKDPLLKIINEFDPVMKRTNSSTIIFCNSIPSCQAIDYFLKDNGIDAVALHGDVPKKMRIQNFERFKNKEVKVLISTDLGSRGLDFPFVTHIINFDFPKTTSDYLHRAGRAGRAGKKGFVTSFYHKKDYKLIEELQKSNEERRPLQIRGSAFVSYKENGPKKPEVDDGLQKISNNEEMAKYLPKEYIELQKQLKIPEKKTSEGRVRGYKKGKDLVKQKIRSIKREIKMPKVLRTANKKKITEMKRKLRSVHKRKFREKKKEIEKKKNSSRK